MNQHFVKIIILVVAIMATSLGLAQDAKPKFASEEQSIRYDKLTQELRCLVCQNENLADSTAPLAIDLRNQVATLIKQEKSDRQIKDYLTQRYGEFILFNPTFSTKNFLLWLFPFVLAILGLVYLIYRIKKQSVAQSQPLSENETKKLNELLK